MKIIVDTSVLSEFLRKKKKHPQNILLETLINNDEEIIILGIIFQEILSGISNHGLFNEIKNILIDLPSIEPQKEDYIKAALLRNKLLRKGISVSTVDILISAVAINHGCFLMTNDKDFDFIAKNSELEILTFEKYQRLKKR